MAVAAPDGPVVLQHQHEAETRIAAKVKRLVLFHYDQDYSDADVDALCARGRRLLDERGGRDIELTGAVEGSTLSV